MKLYRLSQSVSNDYDTYDSCIVCAPSEQEAKLWHPYGDKKIVDSEGNFDKENDYSDCLSWVFSQSDINVELIGEAQEDLKEGVVLSSFNAG